MPHKFTRRTAIALGSAAALTPTLRPAFASALPSLEVWGPPAGPSAVLAHACARGFLSDVTDQATFRAWRNPDELRAGLTSKTISLSVVPVQAATNLYNRGFPIKLVNVMTKGLLYVVSADPGISSVEALAGKTVVAPFRGDTPDIILDRLLDKAGISDEVSIANVGTPVEAIQMMLTGRADAALLPEPAISAAIAKAKSKGKTLTRVIDIQKEWGKLNGGDAVLPQAGLAVTGPFLAEHGDQVVAIQSALIKASESTLANPMQAAGDAAEALKLPAPVIAQSIQYSQLGAWAASSMRAPIEAMLSLMSEVDPKKIGGKLPDDGFYAL